MSHFGPSVTRLFEIRINEKHVAYFCQVKYDNPLIHIFAGIEYIDDLFTLERNIIQPDAWSRCVFRNFKTKFRHETGEAVQNDPKRNTETQLIDFFVSQLVKLDRTITASNFSYSARYLANPVEDSSEVSDL